MTRNIAHYHTVALRRKPRSVDQKEKKCKIDLELEIDMLVGFLSDLVELKPINFYHILEIFDLVLFKSLKILSLVFLPFYKLKSSQVLVNFSFKLTKTLEIEL